MRYFHYSTWNGEQIAKEGRIEPSHRFVQSHKELIPPLVFLTSNAYWEPSVQARDPQNRWEKGPSSPIAYSKAAIPCWRFEVDIPEPIMKMLYYHPEFMAMLRDGQALGSLLSEWHWTTEIVEVLDSKRWYEKGWV